MTHFTAVFQNAVVPTSEQQRLSDLSAMVPELWTHSFETFEYVTHTHTHSLTHSPTLSLNQSIKMSIKERVLRHIGGHHTALILKKLTENLKFKHDRKESTLSVNFGVPVY
jgi:hypothetical protein